MEIKETNRMIDWLFVKLRSEKDDYGKYDSDT